MTKTTKGILSVVIIILVAGLIYWGVTSQKAPGQDGPKETIKIGVILPLTGGQANLGQSAKNAILMAQDEMKDKKFNYQVIFEDDALDKKMTSNAVNKLVNVDQVDALISFTSGSGNVVSPVAQENKKLHIGIASDSNIAKGEYNFLHWTTPEAEAQKWVEELSNREIKSFAFIGMNQQGTVAILDKIKEEIKDKDIEIVDEQLLAMGTRDFRVAIEKAKSKNPEIIYIQTFSPDLEVFAKQYKELGVEIPLTAIEAFEFTEEPALFEGYWYVQSAEAKEEFTKRFEARYSDNPQLGSTFVYDAYNLIVAAYESANEINNEKAIDELSEIDNFSSAVGKISVGDNGIVWSDAVVKEIRNGKPIIINK